MYRYFVLLLVGGFALLGAYYVREAGIEKVFSYIPNNGDETALTPDDVIGKYVCDENNGCKEPYEITLYLNSGAKFARLETESTQEVTERGSWSFVPGGLITITLDEKDGEKYDPPVTLLVQSVGTSSLSKVVYNMKLYPDITKPKFIKKDL
jgi:hypothetical protein